METNLQEIKNCITQLQFLKFIKYANEQGFLKSKRKTPIADGTNENKQNLTFMSVMRAYMKVKYLSTPFISEIKNSKNYMNVSFKDEFKNLYRDYKSMMFELDNFKRRNSTFTYTPKVNLLNINSRNVFFGATYNTVLFLKITFPNKWENSFYGSLQFIENNLATINEWCTQIEKEAAEEIKNIDIAMRDFIENLNKKAVKKKAEPPVLPEPIQRVSTPPAPVQQESVNIAQVARTQGAQAAFDLILRNRQAQTNN